MKTRDLIRGAVAVLVSLSCFAGCGDSPTAEDAGNAAVELRIAAKSLDASALYTITVSGPGMSTIGPMSFAGAQTVEFSVPRGDTRVFRFTRHVNNALTDTGTTVQDIRNAVEIVPVTLVAIITKPSITSGPTDQTVNVGMSAKFEIVAAGMPLHYRWYRDSVLLNIDTNSVLSLTAQHNDSGAWFHCEVYNDAWVVASPRAQLHVVPQIQPPQVLAGPDDDTVAVGETAVFQVKATGVGLTYQWYRDGTTMAGQMDSVLSVPGVAPADSGSKFMCRVTNTASSKDSREAVLHVFSTPAQTLWQSMPKPGLGSDYICDAVSTPTHLVIVGRYGLVYTSPNTFPPVWTAQTSGVSSDLNAVCLGTAKLVAVGRDGNIVTSVDGALWTPQSSGTNVYLNGVAHNGMSYMAVGMGGTVLTSSDAVIWTARTYPGMGDDALNGVRWIGGKWFVLGANIIMSTTDAETWVDHATAFKYGGVHNADGNTNFAFKDIAWSGSRYILSYYPDKATGAGTYSSIDLATWTAVAPAGLGSVVMKNIVWTGTHFATANESMSVMSADGVSWESHAMPENYADQYYALTYTGTHLLAVGSGLIAWAKWPPQ